LERSLGTSKRFIVVVRDGDIIVGASDFHAVYYYKPTNQPQLILRRRSETDDHELLAQAWQAANDKARTWMDCLSAGLARRQNRP
jgi:hypothetical protein